MGDSAVWKRLVRFMLRPAMRLWAAQRLATLNTVPRPLDEPNAVAAGESPARILLLGGGLALGLGVLSNDLALPGQMARMIALQTGRGAEVDLRVAHHASELASIARSLDLEGFDGVVVTADVGDLVALTPPPKWEASMTALIDEVLARVRPDVRIVLATVQPIHSQETYDSLLGNLMHRHSRITDSLGRGLADKYPRVVFIPTEEPTIVVEGRYRTADQYRLWAEPIVAALEIAALGAKRPTV
ncbi:hypothetical protein BH09ACT1_BH09ACT1_12170 [soil metagenome]